MKIRMPGLQGSFKIADADDGLQKVFCYSRIFRYAKFEMTEENCTTEFDIM